MSHWINQKKNKKWKVKSTTYQKLWDIAQAVLREKIKTGYLHFLNQRAFKYPYDTLPMLYGKKKTRTRQLTNTVGGKKKY